MDEREHELRQAGFEPLDLQMGPSHPATHGTVKMWLKLDGEIIVDCRVDVGFLHRGFEKECESGHYYQVVPYTDRLNYSSPMLANIGYCLAAEKLFGVEVPERCQYVRVIVGELSRVADHLVCVGAGALELAAMTPFLYAVEARELIWDLFDAICGARVTCNYVRIGGVRSDLPAGFAEMCREKLRGVWKLFKDIDQLLTANPIFRDRMEGTGMLAADELISFGVTGPLLRAAGVSLDLRRTHPYLVYDRLDFEIPVGSQGDNYDRYLVRMEEIRQSLKLVEQAVRELPDGPVDIDDPRIRLPGKSRVFSKMEELIGQFKLVTEGMRPPPGEVYQAIESANGELGFYLVSDGSGKPVKCHCRSPSFVNMQPLSRMVKGGLLADVIPTFDMVNMIGGECDR